MKILLTGANGFLGKVLHAEAEKKFDVVSIGRNKSAMLICDLTAEIPVIPPVDIVVHAAGKAHMVPATEKEKKDFFKVNVAGTENFLIALENNPLLKKFVFISSVAVYGLMEGEDITEESPLLASDPYGKSKIEAEKLIIDWCVRKNISYYILRLPLIAGKNAPGNLGAMVKGIRAGSYPSIGKAQAKKSMILATDLAEFITTVEGPSGVYNLTDGYHPSFKELEHTIATFYKKKDPISIPMGAAKALGLLGDVVGEKFPINSKKLQKIMSTLTFDDSKARAKLNWKSREVLKGWEIE